jgi:sterol desaturase/sphingolipid hydroxylase (fatty acid hydroxylase superfamily)
MTESAGPEFRFGEGAISWILSATLGTLGFGAVLCLLYPQWLTSADMRAVYPMGLVRALIQFVLAAAFAFVPLYAMGFSPLALYGYLMFASIQGIAIHSNLRFDFGPLRYALVTPQFHHWHHTSQREWVDRNFAIHLPLIDWLFGTYHLPSGVWPERYGIEGNPVPDGWLRQLMHPFFTR